MVTSEQRAETRWLVALADPRRLAILRYLASGDRSASALVAETGVAAANISGHLRTLVAARLVASRKAGRFVLYALTGARITGSRIEFAHPSGMKLTVPRRPVT